MYLCGYIHTYVFRFVDMLFIVPHAGNSIHLPWLYDSPHKYQLFWQPFYIGPGLGILLI